MARLGITKTYNVQYTNQMGKKVSRIIRAIHSDNAFLYAQHHYNGKNIKVRLAK